MPTAAPIAAPRPTSTAPVTSTVSDAQRELDAWDLASASKTRAAFERFVAQFPDGRYTPQARTQLAGMAPAPVAAPAPAPAPAPRADSHNPQAEFEVWDRASTSNRKADYEAYLRSYPNGRYIDLARAAIKKLP